MKNKQAQQMLMEVTPTKFVRTILERAIRLSCKTSTERLDTNTLKSALNRVMYGKYKHLFDFGYCSLETVNSKPAPDRGLNVSFTIKNPSKSIKDLLNLTDEEEQEMV